MRKAAADHCWSKRDLLADAEKRQIDVGLSGRDYYGRRLEAELLSRSIRAIDVDEALAGMPPAHDAVARLVEAARQHLTWIDYDFPSGVREQELAARNTLRAALAAMETSHAS